MKLYMSGIADRPTFDMMVRAGAPDLLVDTIDLDNVPYSWTGNLALDSGAYRVFRKDRKLDPYEYCLGIKDLRYKRHFDFVMAPDVIGDAASTLDNWHVCVRCGMSESLIPVYQWRAPLDHLDIYLKASRLVAIGGLVPLMREKNEDMLHDLSDLCRLNPHRFHILGINWLRAIQDLRDTAYSGDTSKMLDGGRYGHVIFMNTRTGRLSQAPTKAIPEYTGMNRAERIIYSAQSLIKCAIEGVNV